MKIRKATSRDRLAIRRLIRAYPDKLYQGHLPLISEFFVAVDPETKKVIGCCALAVYSKRLAEIRSLAVSPAYHGKGIGTALIKACTDKADKKKVHEIISVTGAKELFEKHGFDTFKKEKYAMIRLLES